VPRLSFKLGFRSAEMNSLDLPVEVRKPNSALVARTRTSQTLDLSPGLYYVTTRLPAGQEITRPVELTADQENFLLEPDPEDRWDNEWDEQRHFLDPPRSAGRTTGWADQVAREPPEQDVKAAPPMAPDDAAGEPLEEGRVYLRVFTGNVLTGRLQGPAAALQPEQNEPGRIVYLQVHATAPILVQHLEVGTAALNLVVPPGARLAISRRGTAESRANSLFKMEAFTRSASANLLLRYGRQGAYQRAGDTARSERLLAEKIDDPVAAAGGAFALLRLGELEALHDWTENLRSWFPWLPDGAAIRGEHLARLGRHAEALTAFAELPKRGLPVLADGLFYAYERARRYSRLKSERSRDVDVGLARTLLETLEPYARVVHRQRPFTSFPGVDPARPDFRRLRAGQIVPGARELHGLVPPETGPSRA
jgi:hypothetical protein